MILHTLKIIWTEKRVNIWILIELILVFCIMWFCVDYIYFLAKKYIEPEGFDIENVYAINLGIKDEGQAIIDSDDEGKKTELFENIWTILDRIKAYPEIENTCISYAAVPYSDSWMSNKFFMDTVIDYPQNKSVTSEYFDVFRINMEKGKAFSGNNMNEAVISGDMNDILFKRSVFLIDTISRGERSSSDYQQLKITGVANKAKRSQFDSYNTIVYLPFKRNQRDLFDTSSLEISVRVKAGTAKGFQERFSKNMQEQIAVGPYFLSSVQSFGDIRDNYLKDNNNNLKSIYSITAFLLINIFLAVVGTFWFRIQSRRSEIGLRIALGASPRKVKKLFMTETLILLFMASIIATVICVNVTLVDVLKDIGVPSINRERNPIHISQYFINYGLTFIILAVIAVAAVWYPAWRASKIQPAKALKDE